MRLHHIAATPLEGSTPAGDQKARRPKMVRYDAMRPRMPNHRARFPWHRPGRYEREEIYIGMSCLLGSRRPNVQPHPGVEEAAAGPTRFSLGDLLVCMNNQIQSRMNPVAPRNRHSPAGPPESCRHGRRRSPSRALMDRYRPLAPELTCGNRMILLSGKAAILRID